MKVRYGEGLATDTGPEPCPCGRKGASNNKGVDSERCQSNVVELQGLWWRNPLTSLWRKQMKCMSYSLTRPKAYAKCPHWARSELCRLRLGSAWKPVA